jgi:multiple sugar transport system permease protein
MKKKESLIAHSLLTFFSLLILLPIIWIFRTSLVDKLNAYKNPPQFDKIDLTNYFEIFINYPFANYFFNSIIIAFGTTLLSLPLATMISYSFARYNTGGRFLRLSILASQMLPPIVLVLPIFSIFLHFQMINTYIGLILAHSSITLPFLAWIMISFFSRDILILEQAARVDGATRLQAFLNITIPLIRPALVASFLLSVILSWNEFLYSLILSGRDTNTLPIGLSTLQTHKGVEIALVAAATMISILPSFIILPFIKTHLIRGLSLGALK